MDSIVNAFKTAFPPATEQTETQQTTEPAVTESTVQETTETTTTTEVPKYDIKDFNDKYGRNFGLEVKEEKELADLFAAPTKNKEYETKLKEFADAHDLTKKELKELSEKYESEKENLKFIDIKKYFANDGLYKTNAMLLKFPDKDPSTMIAISNLDLTKADPVDLLVKQAKLNDFDIFGQMSDAEIKEVIGSKFNGVNLADAESWDAPTKASILLAAKGAAKEFKALQEIELPVPVDIEKEKQSIFAKEKERFEQSKQQWSPIIDKMLTNFTELTIPDEDGTELHKYAVELSEPFKAEVAKYAEFLAYNNQPINEQTITEVVEGLKGRFIAKELPKILKTHAQKIATQKDDEWHAKVNNDKPLSDATRPSDAGNDIWGQMVQKIQGK